MPKPLSLDLRTRVLEAGGGGMSHRAAVDRIGVSAASVSRWRALEAEHGAPVAKLRGSAARIEAEAELIHRLLRETPDITIEELRAALAVRGHAFGYGTVRRFSRAIRSRGKKSARASEQDRPDVLKKRRAWFETQLDLDPGRLVFINENEPCRAIGPSDNGEWRRRT